MSQPSSGRRAILRVSWRASVGTDRRAAILLSNLNANQSALERDGCAVPIDVGISGGQVFLSAGQGGLRPGEIDLRGKLRRLRQNGNAVRQDFGEPADDSEVRRFLAAGVVVAQLSDSQFGNQRRVPRQYAEVAFGTRKLHFLRALAKLLSLRRDDHELDGFRKHLCFRRSPSFFRPSRELPRWCPPCKTPAPERRHTCLRRFP